MLLSAEDSGEYWVLTFYVFLGSRIEATRAGGHNPATAYPRGGRRRQAGQLGGATSGGSGEVEVVDVVEEGRLATKHRAVQAARRFSGGRIRGMRSGVL